MGQINSESNVANHGLRGSHGRSTKKTIGNRREYTIMVTCGFLGLSMCLIGLFLTNQYGYKESFFSTVIGKNGLLLQLGDNEDKQQRSLLMSCSALRQRSFFSEELMFTIRNWPEDEPFSTESNCIHVSNHHQDAHITENSNENGNDNIGSNTANSHSGDDVRHCQCRNPTIPVHRTAEFWQTAFDRNQGMAITRSENTLPLDVVLLGDSITEHWLATTGGMESNVYAEHQLAFREILTREGGGDVDALALGIAADRIPNLLFRLRAARYTQYLKPTVWWIEIGTNDLAMGWCNPDAILAGNIAVVEEILVDQPRATIVINSILPRLPNTLQPYIDEANRQLRQYACETKSNVHFFNATSLFKDEQGKVIHLFDGVHPDGSSSRAWAKEISRSVQQLSGTWW